jgi:hypothetical protein
MYMSVKLVNKERRKKKKSNLIKLFNEVDMFLIISYALAIPLF